MTCFGQSKCSCEKNPHHTDLELAASKSGWDGNQAWDVCKAGKNAGTFCQPSIMNECCIRECTQLHRGDKGSISDCKYDCGVHALNGCNQGGGGGDQPDKGKKIGENCCRFNATQGGCEVVGTCYEKECTADGDSCYPNDALNKCSTCHSAHGDGSPPDNTQWSSDQKQKFFSMLKTEGVPDTIAPCIEKNIEEKYTYNQFDNLPHTQENKDFIANLVTSCTKDPNYDGNYNRVGSTGTHSSGQGLSTLAIVGIVASSVIVLIGLIALFMSIKKNKKSLRRTRVDI
jgi:hypothetical protein